MDVTESDESTWRKRLSSPFFLAYIGILSQALSLVVPGTGRLLESTVSNALRSPRSKDVMARAAQITTTLEAAAEMIEDLQLELRARTAAVEAMLEKTREAEERADNALRRAELSEEQAAAIDAFFGREAKRELGELERRARKREWIIGTVVALLVGLASILVSHYVWKF